MTLGIDELLRRQFALASLRKLAKTIRNPDIWQQAGDIMRRSRDLRTSAKDLFESTFEARVQAERKRLIDEAGKVKRDFSPRWAGTDAFNPERIGRVAADRVRLAHEQRLMRIDTAEATLLAKLCKGPDNSGPDAVRQAFDRPSSRRRRRK